MKFVEPLAVAAALVLRLLAVPWRSWAFDWIVVAALLWGGLVAFGERPACRKAAVGLASVWLFAIYAASQGRATFWLITGP